MTGNEKLAKWQGWSRTNGGNWINPFTKMTCFEHPDYLNDDAAAMSLLDTLVEKGMLPVLRISDANNRVWRVAVYDNYCDKQLVEITGKSTRREAVVAACLKLIDRENTDDPTR